MLHLLVWWICCPHVGRPCCFVFYFVFFSFNCLQPKLKSIWLTNRFGQRLRFKRHGRVIESGEGWTANEKPVAGWRRLLSFSVRYETRVAANWLTEFAICFAQSHIFRLHFVHCMPRACGRSAFWVRSDYTSSFTLTASAAADLLVWTHSCAFPRSMFPHWLDAVYFQAVDVMQMPVRASVRRFSKVVCMGILQIEIWPFLSAACEFERNFKSH